jgi:general secretion pathway protein G
MKKRHNAFTIIELLVVISVISIIVGIVIPRFKGMQDEANKSKAQAELKTLQTGVESWFINHSPHAYPETTERICEDYLNTANPLIVSIALYDPFISQPGTEYRFFASNSGAYYVIWSVGPDGESDITGIDDTGAITGDNDDDVFATNGTGLFQ